MATLVTPPVAQPTSGVLGFWETTVGRSVRRAAVLAFAAAATTFLGHLVDSQVLQTAANNGDKIALLLYWVARTVLDLLNPKISNLS